MFYYFGYDALGSQVAVLNTTGSLVGAQLYGPYGASRYSTGTLPTSIGFTGQRGDSVTGLDYYNARYYDPGVGQFLSADSVQGNAQGMDPYAYVGGNPETKTDPTGQKVIECAPGDDCSGGNGGGHGPVKCVPGEDCSIGNGNGGSGNGGGNSGGGSTTTPTPTLNQPAPPPHKQPSSKGNGCDLQCRAAKAATALHAYYAKETAFNSVLADVATIAADLLGVAMDWGNMPAVVVDVIGSFIPHLLHMIADFVAYNGGIIPPLLQGLMAAGDALAGVVDVVKSFAIFAFSVSGVIRKLTKEIVASAFSAIFSAGGSFVGMKQDVINMQDSNIDNVWTPQQVIDHCQAAGLSSCG